MSGFNSLVQNRIQASMFNKHLTHGARELRRNSCPAGRYCTEATGKLAASRAAAASLPCLAHRGATLGLCRETLDLRLVEFRADQSAITQGGRTASKRKKSRGWSGNGVKRRLAEPSPAQV